MAYDRWKTLKSEIKNSEGSRTFIEVKRTKDTQTDKEFITIAKGFTTSEGGRRYQKAVTAPLDLIDFISEALQKMK